MVKFVLDLATPLQAGPKKSTKGRMSCLIGKGMSKRPTKGRWITPLQAHPFGLMARDGRSAGLPTARQEPEEGITALLQPEQVPAELER